MNAIQKSFLIYGIGFVACVILFFMFDPFSYNSAGNCTVVTQASGHQFVQYQAGVYYAGFFAKEGKWADAFGQYTGSLVPMYTSGSAGGNASNNALQQFMDFQNMKVAKDMSLNMNVKGQ